MADLRQALSPLDQPDAGERTRELGPVVVMRPTRGWVSLGLRSIWEYRELLYFLVWRDVKVRYKQTVLGAAWAVLQPLLAMIIFTVFFGHFARIPSDGIPYPVFAYAGLVPWMYFSNALTDASNSLTAQERMITRVYFPRTLVPLGAVLALLVDFAIALVVLVVMMLIYGIHPSPWIWIAPFLVGLVVATALGVGFWLSALNVQYRDVRYVVPFLTQIWLFATPVAYPSSILPRSWRIVDGINPMAGVIEGFRWALLGRVPAPGSVLLVSTITAAVLLVSGMYYFRRVERTLADVV